MYPYDYLIYNDYLMHHGILGQKWGIRRFQNADGSLTPAGKKRYGADSVDSISSSKGIQKRLNDVDIAIAYNKRDEKNNTKAHNKHFNKGGKILQKNIDNIEKTGLVNKKVLDEFGKAAEYKNKLEKNNEAIIKGLNETKNLLKKAEENGYTINSKEVDRYAQRAKDGWGQMLFGLAGIPITIKNVKENTFKGKQYKIEEDEYDKQIHKIEKTMDQNEKNRSNPPSYMDKKNWNNTVDTAQETNKKKITKINALKSAKNEDKWDMNFLEAIQNSKIFDEGNTSAMLKEYDKYLDDPEDYWKNRKNKLQQA